MAPSENQYLFAYGTLRSDQPEHLLHGPQSISRSSAQVAGLLYQLEEGYPILVGPDSSALIEASENWNEDWANALIALETWKRGHKTIGVPRVLGELIEIPLGVGALSKPDVWEGVKIGNQSTYQRIVVPAMKESGLIVPAWVYSSQKAPQRATPLVDGFWVRPQTLGL